MGVTKDSTHNLTTSEVGKAGRGERRSNGDSYFLVALLLAMAMVIGISTTFRYYESKLLPLIIGSGVFILAAVQLWRNFSARDIPPTLTAEGSADIKGSGRRVSLVVGWVVGAALGVYLFGFLIGITTFGLSYLKLCGRGWGASIATAAITTALVFGIFQLALHIDLYEGLIINLIIK